MPPLSLTLHSESPGDEDAIDLVNCCAFGSACEGSIVRLMRQTHPAFDRRFSITAWADGRLVGHTLFTPLRMRLMGSIVGALAVGPVAVLPEYQKRGIGGRLLDFGHELGRNSGFSLCFLHGHPGYYPRYGYVACHGFPRITIDTQKLPQPARTFRRTPVYAADLPWLAERYDAEHSGIDFAWIWGANLAEWTAVHVNALMWWTEDGRRAAYTLATPGRNHCRMVLADDPALARDVLATIRPPQLEQHPSGWLARCALGPLWGKAEVNAGSAAMAKELVPGVLDAYRSAVAAGERLVGATMFPIQFML